MGADARPQALLAPAPDAAMLAYARSPAFLALALAALVGADAAAQALLAPAPAAVMLAYLRSAAFLARVLAAVMLAFSRRHFCSEIVGKHGLSRLLTLAGRLVFAARSSQKTSRSSRPVASYVLQA